MAGAVGTRRSDSRPIFCVLSDGKSHANPPLLIQFTVTCNPKRTTVQTLSNMTIAIIFRQDEQQNF